MKNVVEVREHDCITRNSFSNPKTFDELRDFLLSYVQTSSDENITSLLEYRYKRNVGMIMKVKNYVGVIELKSGTQLQILPKITQSGEEDKTKQILLKMLRTLKDFPVKKFANANLDINKMNLYEIFINMYIQELQELIKYGLNSSYCCIEDNANYYRGRLNIYRHLKENLVHKERFSIIYDDFSQNNPENRIIKTTLLKLSRITNSLENYRIISHLLVYFENVEASKNASVDLERITIDKKSIKYSTIIKWSKIFLNDLSFSTFSGDNIGRALLFPMDKIFESYVAQIIKKQWEGNTFLQNKKYYLFDDPKKFLIKPDIVLETADKKYIILDTKWKMLTNDKLNNYGISQADMYQMYVYAKKYKSSNIYLLYPLYDDITDLKNSLKYRSFKSEDNEVNVHIYFINLEDINNSIKELLDSIRNN